MTVLPSKENTLAVFPGVIRQMDALLDENCFHGTISRERKRTERSHRPFLLMLLDAQGILENDTDRQILQKIVTALSPAIRETDIIGWYKSGAVLGLLFTELANEHRSEIVGTMLTRVSGILYSALAFEEYNQITISHHVFPEEWDHDVPQRPSHPTLYPDLSRRENQKRGFAAAKRFMDVVGSAMGLILGAPLFLGIACAVKLTSPGPVFFRQQRVGQYGKPFVFLKFRSMYVNNDARIHRDYVQKLISGRAEKKSDNGTGEGVYKLTNDPRITKIGGFLRRTSLDELPQLFNVLVGDMSLVGPRPAIPYEVEQYEIWHRRRVLEAKPGITGLWQVNGRSRVEFDEMVRLDVRYAMSKSLWLDVKILLRTPHAVLMGDGAY